MLDKLIKEKIVVECDTKEEEVKFLQWCIDNKLPWFNGSQVSAEVSSDSKGRYTIEPTDYSSVNEYGLLLALASYGKDRIKKYSDLFPQDDGLTLVEVYNQIKDGEVYEINTGDIEIKKYEGECKIWWKNSNAVGLNIDVARFKLKRKPLTFNEVVELNKKNPVYCTVEHWLINKNTNHRHCGKTKVVWDDFASGKYVKFSDLLAVLSALCGEFISEIILTGEWYVKEGK